MPGPGAYWFGKEEIDEVMEVMKQGYLITKSSYLCKPKILRNNLMAD